MIGQSWGSSGLRENKEQLICCEREKSKWDKRKRILFAIKYILRCENRGDSKVWFRTWRKVQLTKMDKTGDDSGDNPFCFHKHKWYRNTTWLCDNNNTNYNFLHRARNARCTLSWDAMAMMKTKKMLKYNWWLRYGITNHLHWGSYLTEKCTDSSW